MRSLVALGMLGACSGSAEPVCKEPADLLRYQLPGDHGPQRLVELQRVVVGGSVSVPLYCDTKRTQCGTESPCLFEEFDLPYDIDFRDGLVSYAGRDADDTLQLRADRIGSGLIEFFDPRDGSRYGEVAVHVSELVSMTLKRDITEREPPGLDVVLAAERYGPSFSLTLLDADGYLLDDASIELQLPPGSAKYGRGVYLPRLASGMYTLGFKSSGKSLVQQIEIVNEADSIEMWDAPATIPKRPIAPGAEEYVCFMAKSGGRAITGLEWSHVVDGFTPVPLTTHGCVVAATDRASGSLVTFTAYAGGKSLTVQVPAR
jgi:hypothetical protein